MGRTGLHRDEGIPSIEGAAVTQAGGETTCYDGYIGMIFGDISF